MNVLVLGGGGFIGSSIVDGLLKKGHVVRIFEHPLMLAFRQFSTREKIEWIKGDWLDSDCVVNALEGMDAVIHLISTTLPKDSDLLVDAHTNLMPTLSLLEGMASRGISKLIYSSSGGTVYGEPLYTPINESHPTNPKVLYGVTKLAIENYISFYSREHGIRAKILRVSNPYGERQKIGSGQGAISIFLHKALKGEVIEIWGNGSVQRDYIYIEDVAQAFVQALSYQGEKCIFNIGSGEGKTLNELLDLIELNLGRPVERNYLAPRPFDAHINVLDNSLAKSELEWAPKISLNEGINRMVNCALLKNISLGI